MQSRYFYIHFGFVAQSSKDCVYVRRRSGLHGETCHVLLRDHFSNTLYGALFCRRLGSLHSGTSYVLLCDEISNTLYGAVIRFKAPLIERILSYLNWSGSTLFMPFGGGFSVYACRRRCA
jgi:hypothetical protein